MKINKTLGNLLDYLSAHYIEEKNKSLAKIISLSAQIIAHEDNVEDITTLNIPHDMRLLLNLLDDRSNSNLERYSSNKLAEIISSIMIDELEKCHTK